MAIQTFTSGQVLTAAQVNALQANDYNQTVSNKTASYTLVAADKGTRVVMSNASATTITVNTGLFAAGDTLFIQNIGAGVCTITAGTATVSTTGSLALAQNAGGTLYFTSAGVSVFFASAAASASGLTLINTTAFSGVASQSFNSVFSSTYDYYVIKGRVIASGDNTLSWRIRDTTTDVTSSIYYFGGYYIGSSLNIAPASQNNTNTTSASLAFLDTNYGAIDLTVFNPFNTNYTSYVATTFGRSTNVYSGVVNDQLSHNGITFLPNTGTITGSISIFGVQK